MTVPADNAAIDRFSLLYGLCAQAVRHAESFEILARRGHAREGGALARCALEYAVSAQYVLVTPEALTKLRHHVRRRLKEYFGNMADWYDMPLLRDELKGQPEPDPGILWPNFSRTIVASLDFGHFIQASYASLSRVAHVTDDSVLSFLEEDDGAAGVALLLEPRDGNAYAAGYIAAASAMLAMAVIADQLADPSLLATLDRYSESLSLAMYLDNARTDALNRRLHPERYEDAQ